MLQVYLNKHSEVIAVSMEWRSLAKPLIEMEIKIGLVEGTFLHKVLCYSTNLDFMNLPFTIDGHIFKAICSVSKDTSSVTIL